MCRTGRLWLITPRSAITTDQPEAVGAEESQSVMTAAGGEARNPPVRVWRHRRRVGVNLVG
jgi:hypothetical protein